MATASLERRTVLSSLNLFTAAGVVIGSVTARISLSHDIAMPVSNTNAGIREYSGIFCDVPRFAAKDDAVLA